MSKREFKITIEYPERTEYDECIEEFAMYEEATQFVKEMENK